MKKLMAILLILAIAVPVLAACTNNNGTPATTTGDNGGTAAPATDAVTTVKDTRDLTAIKALRDDLATSYKFADDFCKENGWDSDAGIVAKMKEIKNLLDTIDGLINSTAEITEAQLATIKEQVTAMNKVVTDEILPIVSVKK